MCLFSLIFFMGLCSFECHCFKNAKPEDCLAPCSVLSPCMERQQCKARLFPSLFIESAHRGFILLCALSHHPIGKIAHSLCRKIPPRLAGAGGRVAQGDCLWAAHIPGIAHPQQGFPIPGSAISTGTARPRPGRIGGLFPGEASPQAESTTRAAPTSAPEGRAGMGV